MGNLTQYLKDFPDKDKFDYSNVFGNERNFLELEISKVNKKFNTNSTLLISVQCEEKCFFDLTASRQYDSTIKFLNEKKDNIFFLHKSNTDNIFIFKLSKISVYRDLDVLLNMKAIKGKANVKIYGSTLDERSPSLNKTEKFVSEKIEDFTINSESRDLNDIHRQLDFFKLRDYEMMKQCDYEIMAGIGWTGLD